jgi:hypothetical protein
MKNKLRQESTDSLTQEAINLLCKAAKDEKTWGNAMRDPVGFLSENDEILTKGSDLTLYENDWDPKKLAFHVSELDETKKYDAAPRMNQIPVGGPIVAETGVTSCPPGQRRFKTVKKMTVCIKKGVYKGPPEWVPTGPDPQNGHFEFPAAQEVCLQSIETEIWVWECLTPIPIGFPNIKDMPDHR